MTPAEFHKVVATPNADALRNNVGDMCLGVNAILALDALVGFIHADRHQQGLKSADDIAFRDKLAAKYVEYALVRDAAFALKHGQIRGKKPRLAQRADQVTSYSGAFDELFLTGQSTTRRQ